jgi:hypothetical protein
MSEYKLTSEIVALWSADNWDQDQSLNAEAITYAHERRWINDWERDFCFRIMRKRMLTAK